MKILNNIKEFILELLELFGIGIRNMWRIIFVKDPCKKCIVKSCCSELCDKKIYFNGVIHPASNVLEAKILAWVVLISLVGDIAVLITMSIGEYIAP